MERITQIAKFKGGDSVRSANEWLQESFEKGIVVKDIQTHATFAGEESHPDITILIIYLQ